MFGAVLVAEDAPVRVADRTVIMENAVVRAWPQLAVELGHDVMIGPGAKRQRRCRSTTTPSSSPARRSSRSLHRRAGDRPHERCRAHQLELPPSRVVPEG
jgi:hypothetical protein